MIVPPSGPPNPNVKMLSEIAKEIAVRDQPNSDSSDVMITPGAARTACAASSARNVTMTTIHAQWKRFTGDRKFRLRCGEVSEWLMVPLSKSGRRKPRGFESLPLRGQRESRRVDRRNPLFAPGSPRPRTPRPAPRRAGALGDLRVAGFGHRVS